MGIYRAGTDLRGEGRASGRGAPWTRRRRRAFVAGLAAILALTSLLLAPSAGAAELADLNGTFTESFVPTSVTVVGGYTFLTLQNTGVFEGSLTGTSGETASATVYPDGTTKVVSRGTCRCAFAGRTGDVRFVAFATISRTGTVQGQISLSGVSGDLSGLGGAGSFQGAGDVVVLSGRLFLP